MKVLVGSDHAALSLKKLVVDRLRARGVEVEDMGAHDTTSVDYPDYAVAVARGVAAGAGDFGILCCGTGQGMAMTANKIPGIRAAVCADTFTAHATREHNDANVLCLGERVLGPGLAGDIVDIFVGTPFEGGRHARRVEKINALDRKPA